MQTVTKTVWQYSEELPEETMEFLKGIALDYCKVKNYVYKRYAGIGHLGELTPVYGILNEMRYCGLREQLNLPTVYYELAAADAVTDIKRRWGIVKNKIREKIAANGNLQEDDRIYLRTVLKIDSVYAAVLKRQRYETPRNVAGLKIDVRYLNSLLCRLTRKYLTAPETDLAHFFRISPNGYSYQDNAIRVVSRIPRKRVVIPLKDGRRFDRQIQVHIKENSVALAIPVEVKIKRHDDYTNIICMHIGDRDMFTLANGHVYGAALNEIVNPETERLARKNYERAKVYRTYACSERLGNRKKAENIKANNLGKQKYDRQKNRQRSRTENYVNTEINRMFAVEKPLKIVITGQVKNNKRKYYAKSVNRRLARSFQGYIRARLSYKCRIHSIELEEINSKGTGSVCSVCGAEGERRGGEFFCKSCGYQAASTINSARNIQIKYSHGIG